MLRKNLPSWQITISLLAVAIAVILLGDNQAYAASKLILQIQKETFGHISIKVRSTSFPTQRAVRRHRKVQDIYVEKSLNGGPFQSVAMLAYSGSALHLVDLVSTPGKYRYRLRIHRSRLVLPAIHKRVIKVEPSDLGMPDPGEPVLIPDPNSTPSPVDTPTQNNPLPAGLSECASDDTARMFAALNQQRAQNGLQALQQKALFENAARIHSVKMASSSSFVHDGWFEELVAQGFSYGSAAQNIAKYISDPVDVVAALMTSPGHRANILNPVFQFVGVACVKDSFGIKWWTQDFGAGNY